MYRLDDGSATSPTPSPCAAAVIAAAREAHWRQPCMLEVHWKFGGSRTSCSTTLNPKHTHTHPRHSSLPDFPWRMWCSSVPPSPHTSHIACETRVAALRCHSKNEPGGYVTEGCEEGSQSVLVFSQQKSSPCQRDVKIAESVLPRASWSYPSPTQGGRRGGGGDQRQGSSFSLKVMGWPRWSVWIHGGGGIKVDWGNES